MLGQLLPVFVLTGFVIAFGVGVLWVVNLLGAKIPRDARKQMPYECGVVGQEGATTRMPVKFYLTAILFILFDIEVVFMYPWALVFSDYLKESPVFIFTEMIVFMALLIFGFIFVWRARGLEWE